MGNLKLITTEKFCGVPCDFYKDTNDEILLTREQIGQALEYVNPIKAIQKIHLKHKDRLDDLSVRMKADTFDHHQIGRSQNNNLQTERVYYTERGVMEICRWSRQSNANIFMDWVWDVLAQYRRNQLQQIDTSELENTIKEMSNTLYGLTQTIFQLKKDMEDNKQYNTKTQLQSKKWSSWATKMYSKYELLARYFGISHRELYKNLYAEFQDTYPDIDLAQCVADYCHKHNLDSAYTLEAIEHNIHLRSMFESMVDSLLKRYGLLAKEKRRHETIFSM